MTERVVNVSVPNIVGNAVTYSDKVVTTSTPNVIANVSTPSITTNITTDSLNFVVTGMGEESIPNPSLFKRNQEYANLTDFPSFGFKKSFLEQVAQVDVFKVVVNYKRTFTELKTTSELLKVTLGKNLVDTSLTSEQTYKANYKVFADTFQKSDVKFVTVGKTLADTAQKSDQVRITTGKPFTETNYFTDVLNRQVDYKRTFTDLVDATDDFYGAANIDDDQIANVGKTSIDWITSSDIRSVKLSIVKADALVSSEQKAIQLGKILSTNFSSTEQLRLTPNKVALDTTNTTDVATAKTGKILLDTYLVVDQKSVHATKVAADISITQDQFKYSGTKILSDQYVVQDSLSRTWNAYRGFSDATTNTQQIYLNIRPVVLDTTTATEQASILSNKALRDNFITSDLLTRTVNYNRTFTDIVDSTDDFYGAANIDDDQIAYVGKATIDWLNPVDLIAFYNAKVLADQFLKSDTVYNTAKKVLTDQTANNDLTYAKAYKAVIDTANATDYYNLNSGKTISDQSTSSDTFARIVSYYRNYADQSATSDTKYLRTNKVAAEYAVTSDNFSRVVSFNRSFVDSVNKSELTTFVTRPVKQDTVYTADPIALYTARPVTDTFTRTDTVQKTPNKVASELVISSDVITFYKFTNRYIDEIAATIDSGVINNQSYFAGTYIEPGYVGTNTYFS